MELTEYQDIWFAVFNPSAGGGRSKSRWEELEKALNEKGIRYESVRPESKEEAEALVTEACQRGIRHFIAVGGDGTIHNMLRAINCFCAANSVRPDEFSLAMLPYGSGNDFLRSHNVPCNVNAIASMIADGSFSPEDVVRVDVIDPDDSNHVVNSVYMANIGGYCFDANVCDLVNRQKSEGKSGKLIYVKVLLKLAFHQKSVRTRIVCDGKCVFDDRLFSISIGNGRYSGGGLCQTPSAMYDDGKVNLMVAPVFPVWRLPFLVVKLFREKTEEIPFIHFFEAAEVLISPSDGEEGQLMEVDGDIAGRGPVRVVVTGERINVLDRRLK